MDQQNNIALREHLRYLLRGGGAHLGLHEAFSDFPSELINTRVGNLPYTPWHVLEHMRIVQWDILEFSRNKDHVSPPFPEGYWPPQSSTADPQRWEQSLEIFLSELREMEELVMDSTTELLLPIPHGDGQTILREALLVADHNAYHLGALMTIRKAV